MGQSVLACVPRLLLACLCSAPIHAREVVILQIRVVEGEGLVQTMNSRSTRPISVLICDETGKPVEGATVSFLLPEDGPGGTFRGGLRTQVAITGPDGQAAIRGMEWNSIPGPFQIRVIAARDRTRAGIAVPLYLAERSRRK